MEERVFDAGLRWHGCGFLWMDAGKERRRMDYSFFLQELQREILVFYVDEVLRGYDNRDVNFTCRGLHQPSPFMHATLLRPACRNCLARRSVIITDPAGCSVLASCLALCVF